MQKGKRKGSKGLGEKEKGGSKGKGWSKGDQILATRGTVLGTIHSGSGKRTVLRWIRGRLLNVFAVSMNSSREEFSEPKRMTKGTHTKTS